MRASERSHDGPLPYSLARREMFGSERAAALASLRLRTREADRAAFQARARGDLAALAAARTTGLRVMEMLRNRRFAPR